MSMTAASRVSWTTFWGRQTDSAAVMHIFGVLDDQALVLGRSKALDLFHQLGVFFSPGWVQHSPGSAPQILLGGGFRQCGGQVGVIAHL